MSDAAALLTSLIDASIRFAIVCAAVEWGTRPVRRRAPATVHRLWLLALVTALAFAVGSALVRPVAYLHPAGRLSFLLPSSVPGPLGPRLAIAVYAAVALVFLLRLALGLRTAAAMVRHSRPLAHSESARFAAWAGHSVRARRTIFLETAAITIPMTTGFFQPRVLLPSNWREWPAGRLTAVVRHELAHVERGDYLAALAAATVQAAFWFHPATWLAARRLSLCAELACDFRALEGAPPDVYAEHLLALERARSPRLLPIWNVGGSTQLNERIDALVEPPYAHGRSPQAVAIACCVLVIALLAATPVRIVPLRWPSSAASIPYGTPAHPLHVHRH